MEEAIGLVLWFVLYDVFHLTGWAFIYLLSLGRLSITPRRSKISKYWRGAHSHIGNFTFPDFIFFALGLAIWTILIATIF